MFILLLVAATSAPAEVLAVRVIAGGDRASLRVLTTAEPGGADARREDGEVVIVLEAAAPDGLVLPPPAPPIESILLQREERRTVLRLRVAREVPFELRREGTLVTVTFGEPGLPEAAPPAELYQALFPGAAPEKPEDEARQGEEGEEGLWGGRIRLRPAVLVSYVDADVAESATGEPVRERYLELQPVLGASLAFWGGRLRASYEPRFRTFTTLGGLGSTSHIAGASVELTIAQRLDLQGRHHYARGVLETTEVDPGREYFFPLARFNRSDTSVGARFAFTPRLGFEAAAVWNRVHVQQPAGFPGYDTDTLRAGLGYEVGPTTRASLGYESHRVPASPDRPVIEARADSVFASLRADRDPALSGRVEVAYRAQRNPRAPAAGQRFRGLNYSGTLRQSLGVSTRIELGAGRATNISGFEANAFYVSTSLQGTLTVALPGELSFRAAGGQIWNRYPLAATSIGEPRADDLFGWSVGVGRSFGPRVFVRTDYRRDRRASNLPGFDLQSHAFVVQVGFGLLGEGVSR